MKQLSFNEDFSLYKRQLTFHELPEILDPILQPQLEEIKVQLLIYNENLIETFNEIINHSSSVTGREIYSSKFHSSFELEGRFGRKNISTISGKVLILQHPSLKSIWVIISNYGSNFFNYPIKSVLKQIRPRVIKPIITTPQLEKLLIDFQKQGFTDEIRITQFGQRSKIVSMGAKKYIETDRKWTDKTIQETFAEAIDAGSWVTDIMISYISKNTFDNLGLKINRTGVLSFKGGAKISFYHFVNGISLIANERYNFLKDRSKSKSNNYISKPFSIKFNSSILNSKEQILKLKQILHEIPNYKQTVLHGNPYYHSCMVDFKDGSISEVLILNDNVINIIPQGKSSVRSLQKLCSYIFYNFREGELREITYG